MDFVVSLCFSHEIRSLYPNKFVQVSRLCFLVVIFSTCFCFTYNFLTVHSNMHKPRNIDYNGHFDLSNIN